MQCENSRALRGSKLKAHVCEFSSQSSDSREETASHFAIYYTYRTRETKKFETSHECIDAGLVNVSLTSGNSFVRVHVLFSIKQRFLFAHSSRVVLQLRLVTAVALEDGCICLCGLFVQLEWGSSDLSKLRYRWNYNRIRDRKWYSEKQHVKFRNLFFQALGLELNSVGFNSFFRLKVIILI